MWESERQSSINTIKPNTKAHIHQETSVLGFTRGSIFVTVQEMKITKDDKDISIHPSDTSKWDFAYTGKGYEATLTVSPEDFRRR
ncbi:MAG: hypothetical protein LBQ31_09090 [Bacteroidales bacterium]|nr:hypothetical protein [Bacteroidales bacterium]